VDTLLLGGLREELTAMSYPLLTPEQVADALETVLAQGEPGQAWMVLPGGKVRPHEFAGVPGYAELPA
jgi:hypothetical protein